ncbi:hypothetical protein ACFX2A_029253 [Malus domestica]
MAEGVLFNIAAEIIGRLGSRPFKEIVLIRGVKDELRELEEMVVRLQAVLLDAEKKQSNEEIKLWLQGVEDAIYGADDVLDEFNTEALQRQMVLRNTKLPKEVRLFFSSSNQLIFGRKMGRKIRNVNKRLRVVESCKPPGLEVDLEDTRFITRERVTHSYVPEGKIIGRDADKNAIIQLLLDPISTENVSTISTENVSTIFIVGIGGLGKTALAQLIFNDEKVQNHFELKIWTCVSNAFDLDIVVKKILESEKNGIEQLQKDLRGKVDGKKYLLVLDDVWNENWDKWLALKDLLMGGAKGSRILITTRSKTIATKSNTTKSYNLGGLNKEQSWSLFKKMAFEDGKEPDNSTIKEVGEEIVIKCQGVPLAIKTIGGMLCNKDHEYDEWLNFKDKKLSKISEEENNIIPTLQLSYDVLPSHLKHCFAYCSLFPLDYKISVQRLIKLWVAQGFIKSSNKKECLEDVAYKYYKELLCRSFFQEEEKDELGIIKNCKMHTFMNELANSVSGDTCTRVELDHTNFHEKLHHVSFNFHVYPSKWKVPMSLLKAKNIRTFLFPCQRYWNDGKISSCNSLCTTIVSNFKSLRMLSLSGFGITTLSNCLKKMKHLRYLDLSDNPIETLPDWIVALSNLETIDLSGCDQLVELPGGIKKMINLRHLILEGCYRLTGMPRRIGELNGLLTLGTFHLSSNDSMLRDSAGLGELGGLNELRGELRITNLRHVKGVMSESNGGAPLKEKKHLRSLDLIWKREEDVNAVDGGEDVSAVDGENIIKLMEVLQPHSNLKKLSVSYYCGARFASWFSSLKNIVYLKLSDCERCQYLPPLDNLRSLKFLQLSGLKNLGYISDNERGKSTNSLSGNMSFFPSLEELSIERCPNLKGWWRAHTHNSASSSSSTENLWLPSFPSLSRLTIKECPNVTSMPLYPNVDRIHLHTTRVKVLPSMFFRGASDITHDVGVDVSASSSSPRLSKLTKLSFDRIENLECIRWEWIGNATSLQELTVRDCYDLVSLPEGISNLTSLQELTIRYCYDLVSLPEGISNLTCLQKLTVEDCSILESLPEGIRNLTSLQELTIIYCSGLKSLPEGISNLTSLQKLTIEDCNGLVSLPEGIRNLTSLKELTIRNCSGLVSLPEGISNLTSLRKLTIEHCSRLVSLPEGMTNLPSLQERTIRYCYGLDSQPEGISN